MGEKEGMSCRRLRKVALSAELTVSHQRCMCGMYRMLGAVLLASQNSWRRRKYTKSATFHIISMGHRVILDTFTAV